MDKGDYLKNKKNKQNSKEINFMMSEEEKQKLKRT